MTDATIGTPGLPPPLSMTQDERDLMQVMIDKGELPRDAFKRHEASVQNAVFGHDHKKTRKGEPIEQGIGSPGNETANHFRALLKAEKEGAELPGTYQAAVAEIWKRDPARAAKLNLPKQPKAA